MRFQFLAHRAAFHHASCARAFRPVPRSGLRRLAIVFAALVSAPFSFAHGAFEAGSLTTYRDARYGYSIPYPGDLFRPDGETPDGAGRRWSTVDGRARLVAGTLVNDERLSLGAYRAVVLEQGYGDVSIDYAPLRKSWFVLSGQRDGTMVYERVSFTCGGRLINGWLMIYPVGERHLFDRVVEVVARHYRPGRGGGGDCR
jgi:hypothetical protein